MVAWLRRYGIEALLTLAMLLGIVGLLTLAGDILIFLGVAFLFGRLGVVGRPTPRP